MQSALAGGAGFAFARISLAQDAGAPAGVVEIPEREIAFVNTHTSEAAEVVFKRGDQYDAPALATLKKVLRDHRNGEMHDMDPRLYDLLHELAQADQALGEHLAAMTAAITLATTGPAVAVQTAQTSIVSANPVNWTPHVLDGRVKAIVQTGDTIILGGSFTKVSSADGKTTYNRNNLVAFSATTGPFWHENSPPTS